MRVEIAKLHNDLGNTMIYVTHDQVEAMTMADKIVVLNAGIIEQVGAPLDSLQQPAQPLRRRLHRLAQDEFPRRQGRVTATRWKVGPLSMQLNWPAGANGASVTFGVRPEVHHRQGKRSRRCGWPRRRSILSMSSLGGATMHHITTADKQPLTISDGRPASWSGGSGAIPPPMYGT